MLIAVCSTLSCFLMSLFLWCSFLDMLQYLVFECCSFKMPLVLLDSAVSIHVSELYSRTLSTSDLCTCLCMDLKQFRVIGKKTIIIPIHKKKNKMVCDNYKDISLLCNIIAMRINLRVIGY